MLKKKIFALFLVCAVLLFSGLVLNYGSIKSLGLIDYHYMFVDKYIPVIF